MFLGIVGQMPCCFVVGSTSRRVVVDARLAPRVNAYALPVPN
jgi:hypothetical protein